MPIYEFASEGIRPLDRTSFERVQMRERHDLQRLLRENIAVISPDTLVIAEEFGDWEGARRRIDLLGIDRNANPVVIELKRTEDGGHMELQAIRYAAMISTMTFDQAVDAFSRHLAASGSDGSQARAELLEFLGWDEPDEDAFAQDVRIVLASAEFSRELTGSVLWLLERAIDISCVRLQPYELDGRVLVDVQQVIPLPEAAEYQVQVREKARRERAARAGGADYTRYDLTLGDSRFTAEPKRRVIHRTFRYLVETGVAPEEVAAHCGPRSNRALIAVEGEVGREEFLRLAGEMRAAEGRRFDPIRYFCDDADLMRLNGKTYAFLNQWGGSDWLDAMTALGKAFPDRKISFSPAG
ncbi:hypothetical protein [Amaricoccus tamworthensis]|uniref:hypothetical protein n=1 Tax=Amaricoccus tamworthensis TaxID=57002 RepID=UPI003C7A35A2